MAPSRRRGTRGVCPTASKIDSNIIKASPPSSAILGHSLIYNINRNSHDSVLSSQGRLAPNLTKAEELTGLKTLVCYHCQHSWTYVPPLSRSAECPACRRWGKVCLNCSFYDTQSYHECRESQAEWVKYKDQANFCSYFSPRESALPQEAAPRTELERLFAKTPSSQDSPGKTSLQEELEKFLRKK